MTLIERFKLALEIETNRAAGPRLLLREEAEARHNSREAKPLFDPVKASKWEPTEVLWQARLRSGRVQLADVLPFLL